MTPEPHSALPWTLERYGDGDSLVIHSDPVHRVCFMATAGTMGTQAEIEANAALIVRAVNLHADLIAVAHHFVRWVDEPADGPLGMAREQEWIAHAREILARAKEQTPGGEGA